MRMEKQAACCHLGPGSPAVAGSVVARGVAHWPSVDDHGTRRGTVHRAGVDDHRARRGASDRGGRAAVVSHGCLGLVVCCWLLGGLDCEGQLQMHKHTATRTDTTGKARQPIKLRKKEKQRQAGHLTVCQITQCPITLSGPHTLLSSSCQVVRLPHCQHTKQA